MLTNRRSEHLEKILKRLISDIIYKEINDPRIKFVTITRVKLTPNGKDLKLRSTPEIVFLSDKDMLNQYRILDITKKIKENAISENEISENEK